MLCRRTDRPRVLLHFHVDQVVDFRVFGGQAGAGHVQHGGIGPRLDLLPREDGRERVADDLEHVFLNRSAQLLQSPNLRVHRPPRAQLHVLDAGPHPLILAV